MRHTIHRAGVTLFWIIAMITGRGIAAAQEDFHHPELTWRTIETPRFLVHYHEGAERTARVVARIAEDVYEPVTALYNHRPDGKVSFIIRDHDDISNGAAYFYENRIEIWAPSMDFDLRGTHNWLRNVVTHEFTHIVQIQTSMKFGRTFPGVYLQWLGYESERRPDVLYGFPNVIASYPISGFLVPVWFAEGVAQYNRAELRYDFWDSHRDMILRSYALDNRMLTWREMGVFGKTSLGNESSYNAGFAFVHYLADRYGEEKVREISRNLGRLTATSIDGAIERALGTPGGEVYAEWQAAVKADYEQQVAPIRAHLREGDSLLVLGDGDHVHVQDHREPETLPQRPGALPLRPMQACCRAAMNTGFANLYPAYSPDGSKIAYVTTKGGDYFLTSSLYVYDVATRTEKRLQGGVRTGVSWSPDGRRIYYGRTTRDNPHWSLRFDLHVYDIAAEKETRLTHGARLSHPAVSPDGTLIAAVTTADGTGNLVVLNADGTGLRQVTAFRSGEQVYSPQWSPAGDRILFDTSIRDGRDIASIRPDGSDYRVHVEGADDSRNGVFTPDGGGIIFASDRTGIFNLYRLSPATGETVQLTNVLGGALMPTVNPAGDIVYASFGSTGYTIRRLTAPAAVPPAERTVLPAAGRPPGVRAPVLAMAGNGETPAFDWQGLRSYDDTRLPPAETRPYRSVFSSLMVVPFLRVDNYNTSEDGLDALKLGAYLFSSDVLDRFGFIASAALNKRFERDLFLQFNFRSRIPLLYELGLEPTAALELYNVTRTTNNFLTLPEADIPIEVGYNLLEFDGVLTFPVSWGVTSALFEYGTLEFRYAHSRYTSIIEGFLNPFTSQIIPGSSDLYLIANTFTLQLKVAEIAPTRLRDVSPVGRRLTLRAGYELNKFNGDGEYEVTSVGLSPVYKNIDFPRVELLWKESVPLPIRHHTLTASLRMGSILGPPVDNFFDFYAGGLFGMRGYPFYALGGNEMAVGRLEYRLPLIQNIDLQVLHLYFQRLYGSVFADIGHAWTGELPNLRTFKTDIGAELRLESFSWYSYPTRIFLSAAYGFDRFERFVESRNTSVAYGKEWRFYLGVLFGFDFD